MGESIYETYNQFCLDNFGAEHESLVYQMFGESLEFVDSGLWIRESRNSAALGFETNLPAHAYVEFGETTAYGRTTIEEERFFYLHLHYLTGLEAETTYHYRLIATDERSNQIIGDDTTFQTHSYPEAIDVPGTLEGPPYVLNQVNGLYIVTENITSDTRGISVKANGITLDLNGFTILYDMGDPVVEGEWNDYLYSDYSTTGVYPSGQDTHVYNGIIRQGINNGTGHIGIGYNPMMVSGTSEVAGVTMEWSGANISGIEAHWATLNAHHNVLLDNGTVIGNRHMGLKALFTYTIGAEGIHHNLIKRCRHQGILSSIDGSSIYANEIYQDSYDTNAFGIKPVTDVYDNKIFGTGYHVNAISWRSNITIRHNFVHLQGVAPTTRSDEYGAMSSVNGFRLTQYNGGTSVYENNLYEGNIIVVKGREGCTTMRGVQFSSDPYIRNLRFINNTIKIEVQDELTPEGACVVAHGLSDRDGQQLLILYENNTFISNSLHVKFGDDYAIGGNHQFKNNTFLKLGDRGDYHTIQIGYWILHTTGNLFIDSILGAGVDLEDCNFEGTGNREYSVGHSLYVIAQTVAGDPITNVSLVIHDNTSMNYSSNTNGEGYAYLELLEYTYAAAQGVYDPTKTIHENHSLHIPGYEPYLVNDSLFSIHQNDDDPVIITFTAINDTTPPSLTNQHPTGTISQRQPVIGASLNDDESGVNTSTVFLTVDGINHTSDATITSSSVTYTPTNPLSYSTHTVNITACDNASNIRYLQWSFTVQSGGGGNGGSGDGDTGNEEQELISPIANAGGPYSGYVNHTLIFNGSKSNASDGHITNYTWDFGDNTTAWGVSPDHTYVQAGVYYVNLTVTDNRSLQVWNMTTATIQNIEEDIVPIPVNATKNNDTNITDNSTNNSDEQQTPGFTFVLFFIVVPAVVLWKRTTKK